MFAVFDRYGDVNTTELKEQGIFFEGTRFLSQFEFYLGMARPLLLSSTVKADNTLFNADLANPDISREGRVVVPRETLHVNRRQFLWQGSCYQIFHVINYGMEPINIPFSIRFGADFADIFEVRGMHRSKRGIRLPDLVEKDSVLLSYQGLDGHIRRTHVRCEPAPKHITSSEVHFEGFLEPRTQTTFQLTISCESSDESAPHTYKSAWDAATSEIRDSQQQDCKISSSSEDLNEWINRSQADLQMMVMGNPERNYPYAGVPWFNTVFGRDGIITALQCLWLNPAIACGVLEYLAATQADKVEPKIDAEPGKILHEMRKGEMAILGEVPFARYYGSVDATPLFVMLADAYYARTGDLDLITRIWPNLERALQWIDKYGDIDGDGFVEYSRHSANGLVQQGWKDSHDSVFHSDGSLAEPPIALCEVQGYVYAAKRGAARLASALGDQDRSQALESEALNLRDRFHKAFWLDDLSTYALALDGRKQPCKVKTSNAGHCLYTGIASPEAARLTAQTLMANDSYSGWGVRTVASGQCRYNPISYHNGSIWPHDNSLIAAGLARYGFKSLAGRIFSDMLDASTEIELYRLPELFCGLHRRNGEGPTLYPVACSPQAWAAASTFMFLQASLGLVLDAQRKQIRFEGPYLPEHFTQLWIKNLTLGTGSVDILIERRSGMVRLQTLDKRGDVEVVVT